jgi:hypothetical protein
MRLTSPPSSPETTQLHADNPPSRHRTTTLKPRLLVLTTKNGNQFNINISERRKMKTKNKNTESNPQKKHIALISR